MVATQPQAIARLVMPGETRNAANAAAAPIKAIFEVACWAPKIAATTGPSPASSHRSIGSDPAAAFRDRIRFGDARGKDMQLAVATARHSALTIH